MPRVTVYRSFDSATVDIIESALAAGNVRVWREGRAEQTLEVEEVDAAEAERERSWAAAQAGANLEALATMRRFMPPGLPKMTADEFAAAVGARGGRFPPALAERLKSKKLLQWVVTHPTNISTANFLQGAHKVSREWGLWEDGV